MTFEGVKLECPTCGAQLVAKDGSWLAHRSGNAHTLMTSTERARTTEKIRALSVENERLKARLAALRGVVCGELLRIIDGAPKEPTP
jgi:hypothetical protein